MLLPSVILFVWMNVIALTEKRIKRCEDFLMTGISREKKPEKEILMRTLFDRMFFAGMILLVLNITMSLFYIPEWVILPFGFLALVGILILGVDGMIFVLSVILFAVYLKSGNIPWLLFFFAGTGVLLVIGSFLFSHLLEKKVDRNFESEADAKIRPMLESVMTTEKFLCREHMPFDDKNAEKIKGNCYAAGKWNGITVSYSNLSFKRKVVRDKSQIFSAGLVNATDSFCGIGVTYIVGHKPNKKTLEMIRHNLEDYRIYDVTVNTANKITALLDAGYFFTADESFNAVWHGDQLKIDAKKLDDIFKRIDAGVQQKLMQRNL
ncbi:hypothetical protein [Ruminococcus difficilis]|nr:hypothetical protein [Ruminococcus difficilis]